MLLLGKIISNYLGGMRRRERRGWNYGSGLIGAILIGDCAAMRL